MARRRISLGVEGMGATAIAAVMGLTAFQPAVAHVSMTQQEISTAARAYAIPKGSIALALTQLADESGVRMIYRTRLTKNLTTTGLRGSYTLTQALDALLSGTGLGYRVMEDGRAVAIVLAQNEGVRNDAGAEALPPIDVGAESRPQAGGRVSRSGEPKTPEEGYIVDRATAATKTDVPIKETPVSVQVVPKQVIVDQSINRLQEALENVSGVRSNNNDIEGYNYKIRGFRSVYIFRNGLAIPGGDSNPTSFDTANIESIEVLKGPASILYGRAEPGGLISITTKQPLDHPRYVLEQQFGSYAHYRTEWDLTGPIEAAPGLAYRVTGAFQDYGSFRPPLGGRRLMVAPTVRYSPDAWTEFTAEFQYFGNKAVSDLGFPAVGAAPAPIPLARSFQEPGDPRDWNQTYNVGYNFRRNLTDDWKITNRFLYTNGRLSKLGVIPTGLEADQRTLDRSVGQQTLNGETFSTNIDLEGKFVALEGRHDFLFGLDYLNSYYDYKQSDNSDVNYPIDIYAPIYGTIPPWAYQAAILGTGSHGYGSTLVRQKGFYVQDHITWFDRLHVLLGARYDVAGAVSGWSEEGKDAAIRDRLAQRESVATGWSPRAGALYDLTPEVSVYGSYSESFGRDNGVTASGEQLPPQRGRQYEVGLKAQTESGLTATLAFFQVTKSNVSIRDYASPVANARKLAGVHRSRGIELDVIGRVTDRLSLVANYAYTDAKVISDNARDPLDPYSGGLLHDRLDNVPRHSGKIFAVYNFGSNGLGWRVGGGVTASSESWGDIQNTFVLPAWARIDAFASYAVEIDGHKVTAQLNLRNINNARYFDGVDTYFNYFSPRLALFPAKPFTATGTIRFEF
jgi:iron complex outermembrane receptor protein